MSENSVGIEPVLGKVLIERATALTKSKGGIFIPQKAGEVPVEGKVVAMGSGTLRYERIKPNEVIEVAEDLLALIGVDADGQPDSQLLSIYHRLMEMANGRTIPWDFKVGDTVIFEPNQGQEIAKNGTTYLLMDEHYIKAVIEKTTPDEVYEPTVLAPLPPEPDQ